MCDSCGCVEDDSVLMDGVRIKGHDHGHDHGHGAGAGRIVQMAQDLLSRNNHYARRNREVLTQHGILAVNLISSPGSGKTTLLVRTIQALKDRLRIAVIEGDQSTANDAERIRLTGVPAVQINTGKGCHLDAHMVSHALDRLLPQTPQILLIENVGNLVCPTDFDLGEAHKVVVLSVTEGEDKPIKYPGIFHAARAMLLNKVDLLPYLTFDEDMCLGYARRVNTNLRVFPVSATRGDGFDAWLAWLTAERDGLALTASGVGG